MTDKHKIEVWIAMNEDGDYVVGTDENEASERFDEQIGGFARRVAKLNVKMAPPVIEEIEVDIPDTAGETIEVAAE
jgi:hypothetical protein